MTDEIFPLDKLQPKKETGVDKFLARYPEFDGRGVIVGIMDTLVDASVDGLQVTSEGKPKMLSVMDCSGSGDVQMSVVRTLADDNTIIALSQRTLKVPTSWSCPSGQFRVGMKPLYHLFGKGLQERIKKKRKEKFWHPESREQAALARRKLDADEKNTNMHTLHYSIESAIRQREECLAAVHLLKQYDNQYEDLGQTVDCVLFHDGTHWKLVMFSIIGGVDKKAIVFDTGFETQVHEWAVAAIEINWAGVRADPGFNLPLCQMIIRMYYKECTRLGHARCQECGDLFVDWQENIYNRLHQHVCEVRQCPCLGNDQGKHHTLPSYLPAFVNV